VNNNVPKVQTGEARAVPARDAQCVASQHQRMPCSVDMATKKQEKRAEDNWLNARLSPEWAWLRLGIEDFVEKFEEKTGAKLKPAEALRILVRDGLKAHGIKESDYE